MNHLHLSTILILTITSNQLSVMECNTFHVWNGRLAYYNGDREMSYNDTLELCTSLGGRLPSLHSDNDTRFLSRLIGSSSRVWLGGVKNGTGISDYNWTDGSAFDFHPWVPDEPSCNIKCCAMGFTTVGAQGLVTKDCQNQRRMVCIVRGLNAKMEGQIIPHDINATIEKHEQAIQTLTEINFELMNSSMNSLKQQFDSLSSLGADSKANLEQLNSSVRALNQRLTAFYNSYDQRVNGMAVNLIRLQSLLEDLNQTVSTKTKQAAHTMSLVQTQETHSRDQVDELQKETDRLHTRITFCFFTLILLAAGLLSRAGYKLYTWSRPGNPYKREPLRSSLTEDPDHL